jgi:hypothetical protein
VCADVSLVKVSGDALVAFDAHDAGRMPGSGVVVLTPRRNCGPAAPLGEEYAMPGPELPRRSPAASARQPGSEPSSRIPWCAFAVSADVSATCGQPLMFPCASDEPSSH